MQEKALTCWAYESKQVFSETRRVLRVCNHKRKGGAFKSHLRRGGLTTSQSNSSRWKHAQPFTKPLSLLNCWKCGHWKNQVQSFPYFVCFWLYSVMETEMSGWMNWCWWEWMFTETELKKKSKVKLFSLNNS